MRSCLCRGAVLSKAGACSSQYPTTRHAVRTPCAAVLRGGLPSETASRTVVPPREPLPQLWFSWGFPAAMQRPHGPPTKVSLFCMTTRPLLGPCLLPRQPETVLWQWWLRPWALQGEASLHCLQPSYSMCAGPLRRTPTDRRARCARCHCYTSIAAHRLLHVLCSPCSVLREHSTCNNRCAAIEV